MLVADEQCFCHAVLTQSHCCAKFRTVLVVKPHDSVVFNSFALQKANDSECVNLLAFWQQLSVQVHLE